MGEPPIHFNQNTIDSPVSIRSSAAGVKRGNLDPIDSLDGYCYIAGNTFWSDICRVYANFPIF